MGSLTCQCTVNCHVVNVVKLLWHLCDLTLLGWWVWG